MSSQTSTMAESSTAFHIRPASLADARAVSSVVNRAFANDEKVLWLHQWPRLSEDPDGTRRLAVEREITKWVPMAKRNLVRRQFYPFLVLDRHDGKDEAAGYSCWMAPSPTSCRYLWRRLSFTDRFLSIFYSAYDWLASLIPDIVHRITSSPEDYAKRQRQKRWVTQLWKGMECVEDRHKKKGFWLLAYLTIVPEYHRRGLASRLMRFGLERADEEDRAVYLGASDLAVPLYKRHGFRIVYREQVFQGEVNGGFWNTVMYRPSRSERDLQEEEEREKER